MGEEREAGSQSGRVSGVEELWELWNAWRDILLSALDLGHGSRRWR